MIKILDLRVVFDAEDDGDVRFSIKGYVISEKQFKLEKKKEVMPFCKQMGLIFIIFYKIHTFIDEKNISKGSFFMLNMILLSYFKVQISSKKKKFPESQFPG